MISAEESRKIAERISFEQDSVNQKTKYILDYFERSVVAAAENGDIRLSVRFEKPDYSRSIPTIGMNEAEIFDIFCKHVAPKLRELGYVVETDVDFGYYDMLIKW